MFRECYAMEKIHGTSAHIRRNEDGLYLFSGGVPYKSFAGLFDEPALDEKLAGVWPDVAIYGEAYGGKCQGMSKVYGPNLRFVAFEVRLGDSWLSVPSAHEVVTELGLEFVHYDKIPADLDAIDAARDANSVQAMRNGMGDGHKREGVVLRPLVELHKNNGARIAAKHKREEFSETKTKRPVDAEQLAVLSDAAAVAAEWVTPMRLAHVLDKLQNPGIEQMRSVIAAMVEDVRREGAGEIVWSRPVEAAIGKATATEFKARLHAELEKARG